MAGKSASGSCLAKLCCWIVTLTNLVLIGLFLSARRRRDGAQPLAAEIQDDEPRLHSPWLSATSPYNATAFRSDVPSARPSMACPPPLAAMTKATAGVPPSAVLDFTMNGTVPLLLKAVPSHRKASNVSARLLNDVHLRLDAMTSTWRRHGHLGRTCHMIVQTLRPFLKGKRVLLYGALREPVLEVALRTAGAKLVVVLEHQPYRVPRKSGITVHRPAEYWCNASVRGTQYDVAVAYSSVQHDGLGRYGDTVDPFGDINAMRELWSLVRPGGLLLLGVPIGNDHVVFNQGRVYGRRRLPLLLRGWDVVDATAVSAASFADHTTASLKAAPPPILLRRVLPVDDDVSGVPGLAGPPHIHR